MENLPKKVRSKKLNARVDLTAMVSVSFLLIIFFMVVGELSKPKIMEFDFPRERGCGAIIHEGENRSITILLGENNKLVYFIGLLDNPIKKPQKIAYGKDGIRKELVNRIKQIQEYSSDYRKNITVVIKPSKKSNYGNLVNILDEMKITGINSYSIVDYYTPEESKLLAVK